MKFKAVLFDLDGTLLDTIDDITDSMNAVLLRMGLPAHTSGMYKKFVGEGVEKLAELALPKKKQDAETLRQLALEMREEYSKRWADKTRPYAEIPELLGELKKLHVRMSILSNKPDEFTKLNVEKFLGAHNFDFVCGESGSAPKKPDPFLALKMASGMGLAPAKIIFLGDSWVDMKTAKAAGMYPVGVLWGFREKEELLSSGAAALIEKPLELLDIIEG